MAPHQIDNIPHRVRGPYFDELTAGATYTSAPPVTLDSGLQAAHRAIVGNRLRLPLDATLAAAVTGSATLASPALVWDVSIGQSTVVTQLVKANLFYRGLRFLRFPVLGDTLSTTTTVAALRANSTRPGRERTGMAALHIRTVDQNERAVLDYWRCAMLPYSRQDAPEGPADDLDAVGADRSEEVAAESFADWDLAAFRARVAGDHFADLVPDTTWEIDGADVVSSAPELARLTGNLARVHHDAAAAGGERLVYGGHTIGVALHQITRAVPTLVTVAGWNRCDHLGPVYEGDRLTSVIQLQRLDPLPSGGGLAQLRTKVRAARPDGSSTDVLDWTLTGLLA